MTTCLSIFFILLIENYLVVGSISSVSHVIFTEYFGQYYELHVTKTTQIATEEKWMGEGVIVFTN